MVENLVENSAAAREKIGARRLTMFIPSPLESLAENQTPVVEGEPKTPSVFEPIKTRRMSVQLSKRSENSGEKSNQARKQIQISAQVRVPTERRRLSFVPCKSPENTVVEAGPSDLTERRTQERLGFDRGLEPEYIMAAVKGSKLMYLMKWKDNDIKDMVPASEAVVECPEIVIQYFQSKLDSFKRQSNLE